MLNRQLRAYYRSAMFGNRSTLARAIDFIALRLFVFVALYVWFSLQTAQLTLSAILAGVGVGMVSIALSLYKSIRLDRFVAQKRMELSRDYLFEKMVLLPRHAFLDVYKRQGLYSVSIPVGVPRPANIVSTMFCFSGTTLGVGTA